MKRFCLLVTVVIITHITVIEYVLANALPELPEPVTNNAVAKVSTQQGDYIVSFMGLGVGKTYQDVHNKVWSLKLGDNEWQAKTPVPSSLPLKGRLASIAAPVGDYIYLFGGYTVGADHSEISSPDSFRYDVINDQYQPIATMPVAVDDSVALVYQNRYIYLISGWHNAGNVNLVQIYDTQSNTWQQGSPYLGEPVFGHAAAISDNVIVVCDGVKVQANLLQRRSYAMVNQCLKGEIESGSPARIDWQQIPHPTQVGRYRMAASEYRGKMIFVGGSTNAYNYNGIGYNGEPSQPTSQIWLFDAKTNTWQVARDVVSSMDHRALLQLDNQLVTIGGMQENQQVSQKVLVHRYQHQEN
ncbi:Kelch repeat-containing protein [Thalassotalea maritima]|uniref:Kelch repeat-containing protein n=1 Tax=Thalassotalea maritima TaxID=3242416 RepID=UPI00352839BC